MVRGKCRSVQSLKVPARFYRFEWLSSDRGGTKLETADRQSRPSALVTSALSGVLLLSIIRQVNRPWQQTVHDLG